ncbi:hypothetical protein ACFE04_020513 [Oxalis oulophora]
MSTTDLAAATKPSSSSSSTIVDRFKALLRRRRLGNDDIVPSMDEIVQLYEAVLSELTFNSKPIITDLTIIAGDHKDYAEGIADAICTRIVEIPVEQKLPSLYLLDSIVKNIGQVYARQFAKRLPEVFCEAYWQVHPNMHSAMRHLFGTWSTVFPQPVLRKIETQLQFSSAIRSQPSGLNSLRSSESPRPIHGIHVNPKYIRQLENSAADSDNLADQSEVCFPQVGAQRLNPSVIVSRSSYDREGNKLDKPLSLDGDDFVTSNSYGVGRLGGRDEDTSDWRGNNYHSNGHELERPRALIDAYGSVGPNKMPLIVDHLDINRVGKQRSWQNTEEEEFDWEDMSPTFTDHGSSRPVFGESSMSQLDSTSFRSNFSGQLPLPPLDDLATGRGLTGKFPGSRNESNQILGSHYSVEGRSLPPSHPLNALGRGRDFPFPDADPHFVRPTPVVSRIGSPSVDSLHVGPRPVWPPINVQNPHLPINAINQGPNRSQEFQDSRFQPMTAPLPHHLFPPPSNNRFVPHHLMSGTASNPPVQPPFQIPGRTLPPQPSGPPLASSQPIGANQPQSGAFSGLINSLMAQGLISLTTQQNPVQPQDSVGLDFNVDLLKLRHESAISALYADLPRQCTTCGLRFKCQEEHSTHMDWHVTKNRMSKNRKQKPSRKWFVSSTMWLSGVEALGNESTPGFLPTETTEDKKDDEELAVPADEDQNTCALCGECFDDFYSDETEEWMYRGAVYMNAPDGKIAGMMDKSQLGPIVHAKCRSDSNVVPPEDFEWGSHEDGNQRKRLRN